jgi:hypothetical protein
MKMKKNTLVFINKNPINYANFALKLILINYIYVSKTFCEYFHILFRSMISSNK